ncbi:MAG: hypothetical protein QM762_14670 [Chryseolinea sp.]
MKTVFFDPNNGPLVARATFLGNIVANYEISLRERNSNSQVSLLTGDNLNPEDDAAPAPTPVIVNDGRRAILETGFVGNNPDNDPEYEIKFEILQSGIVVGSDSDTGLVTGKGQFSLIFLRLQTL